MDMDSEQELFEYRDYLHELAILINRDKTSIEIAMENIAERLSEIENTYEDVSTPDFPTNNSSLEKNDFNDGDLFSLFSTLG